jgi:hypothetical protein
VVEDHKHLVVTCLPCSVTRMLDDLILVALYLCIKWCNLDGMGTYVYLFLLLRIRQVIPDQ